LKEGKEVKGKEGKEVEVEGKEDEGGDRKLKEGRKERKLK
jgi:hypothetical protein